jgi:hypothetical protein
VWVKVISTIAHNKFCYIQETPTPFIYGQEDNLQERLDENLESSETLRKTSESWKTKSDLTSNSKNYAEMT